MKGARIRGAAPTAVQTVLLFGKERFALPGFGRHPREGGDPATLGLSAKRRFSSAAAAE
jgi:hypothetical protein